MRIAYHIFCPSHGVVVDNLFPQCLSFLNLPDRFNDFLTREIEPGAFPKCVNEMKKDIAA